MSPLTESLLFGGIVGALPWWGYLIIGAVSTHLLVMSVSLYFHRALTHRAIEIDPKLSVFFRFKIWLAQTSVGDDEWKPTHVKHHRFVDTEKDPHSPKFHSLWSMLLAIPYRRVAKDPETLRLYGRDAPKDWLEKNLFTKHRKLGVLVLAIAFVALFGLVPGAVLWLVEVTYLPIIAMVGVNGVGHRWGYRNASTNDESRNVLPIDFLACGELLHNNHHTDPSSAKFSFRKWEFDIGWGWIMIFRKLGLVKKVNWVYLPPRLDRTAKILEDDAIRAFARYTPYIKNRFDARVRPALERMSKRGERTAFSIQAEFEELCNRARSPSAVGTILRDWLNRATRLDDKKVRKFCEWLIMIRVPASPT